MRTLLLVLVMGSSGSMGDFPVPAGYMDSQPPPETATSPAGTAEEPPQYAEGGDRACLVCHSGDTDPRITAIDDTPHGHPGHPGSPAAGMGCQACHGPSADHMSRDAEGRRPPPPVSFRPDEPAADKDRACLACHDDHTRMDWHGSGHEFAEVSCVGCHTAHESEDPSMVRDQRDRVCMDCHSGVRAEFHRPASHPVLEGAMSCMDCHDPHGSPVAGDLAAGSVNESCYTCHAEFRGPFVWEHDPVRESCLNCHSAHGSAHRGMLERRGPQMCQECHSAAFHPSTQPGGEGVPPTGASTSMLQRNCMNCHTDVHGSNHPSGAGQTR